MKKRRSSKNRKYAFFSFAFIVVIGILVFANTQNNEDNSNSILLGPWRDIHGIGMFLSGDDDILYAATHQGLFKKTDLGWKRTGNDNADLMGFTINSEEEKMYSSGHSKTTGNLGFRTSDDTGISWETVSKVKDTPVDFHAMTASPVQTGLIYGSLGHSSELFVTLNEGISWQSIPPPDSILSLEADPISPDRVYAGTNSGLYVSNDQGKQWQKINSNLELGAVTGIGFAPDGKTMYVSSLLDDEGVIFKSITNGEIMIKTQGQIPDAKGIWDFIPGRNGEVYSIISHQLSSGLAMSIYRTNDGGDTWILEGTNNSELSLTVNT